MANKFIDFSMLDSELQARINSTTSGGSPAWTSILNKPTTVNGYGITDVYTKTEVDAKTVSSAGGGTYLVELNRWGIKNDKTNANATVDGINNAFSWAFDNGFSHVIMPKGNYLIPPTKSITPQNNTYYDLNGSKFYMETNGVESYSILKIGSSDSTKKAHHITIVNGEFIGDRYTHDFNTIAGSHEWGHCIQLKGHCKFIHIENCIMSEGTGDGLTGEYNYDVWLYPVAAHFELGSYNTTTGAAATSGTTIRTITPYDVSHFRVTNNDNMFMLTGDGYGSLAGITCNVFDVLFYDAANNFISAEVNATWYQDIVRPTGATKMHFVLKQATTTNIAFEVRAEPRPQFVTVKNCEIKYNRRLGIACTGMRYFYILDNEIHHNTGFVGGGIDIEDGYRTNQNIYVIGNKFYGHGVNDVIIVGTHYVTVVNNSFNSTLGGSGRYWNVSGNYFQAAGSSIFASDLSFNNNLIHDSVMSIGVTTVGQAENIRVTNNVFRNSKTTLVSSSPYCITLENCIFVNDSNRYVAGATLEIQNNTATVRNILINGGDALATFGLDVTVENSTFMNTSGVFNQWIKYKNCNFFNPLGTSAPTGTSKQILLENCRVETSVQLWAFNSDTSTLELKNCDIKLTNASAQLISVTVAKKVTITNCRIDVSASTSGFVFFSGGNNKAYYIIKDNEFIGTNTNVKPYDTTWHLPVEPVVFLNNTIDGIGSVVKVAGDTYENGTTAQRPRKRLRIGMDYFDTTLNKPIYVKSLGTNNMYSQDVSARNLAYKLGQLVLESGKVHECTIAGTSSATLPTFVTTNGGTTVDGTVTWTCKGDSAVWADSTGTTV